MKKLIAAGIAAALSASAFAAPGVYIQGDVGAAKVKAKNGDVSGSKSGFSPRVSVGYDFGNNFRTAIDYTHYKQDKYGNGAAGESGKTKFHSIGISGIYDIPVAGPVKPYVGGRVGINRVSDKYTETGVGYRYESTYKKTKTGIGAMAGVAYEVTDNLALDAGYRYNYWGKFDDAKVHTHEGSVGVRYKF